MMTLPATFHQLSLSIGVMNAPIFTKLDLAQIFVNSENAENPIWRKAMVSEITISLREIAIRLNQLKSKKEKPNVDRLLALLKTGKLQAGFIFPGLVTRWIYIPQKYWEGIGTDKLRSLNYLEGSKQKIGAYKVKISEFASEYVRCLSDAVAPILKGKESEAVSALLAEIAHGVPLMSRAFEVRVTEQAWNEYLNNHDLLDPSSQKKPTAGAYQRQGWREMSEIIGAYILDHSKKTDVKIKFKNAAEEIHRIAVDEQVNDPPGISMIQDLLSKIHHRAKRTKKS